MKTMTMMFIVGSMALVIPAVYWGSALAQPASGTLPYAPAFVLGQMGLGAAAAGPFMLVKDGYKSGGNSRGFYGRGFYGGSYYPFYGDDGYSYDDSTVPRKVCVWDGYKYTCTPYYDTY